MDGAPRIRRYDGRDQEAVLSLHRHSFTALAAGSYGPDQLAAHDALVAQPSYAEALTSFDLWLAITTGGEVIGSGGWHPVGPAELPAAVATALTIDRRTCARVRKVYVAPHRARQGIATTLVGHVEAQAHEQGHGTVVLRANLNAVPLYRRLGYDDVAPGVIATPGVDLPVLWMAKHLAHLLR
ncbi:MAG: GNAT family N-acetyltransferase [Actinomycetota bacterium]|nr:GNAT family N-acetyltransferase [Actinomycetota bacterium]